MKTKITIFIVLLLSSFVDVRAMHKPDLPPIILKEIKNRSGRDLLLNQGDEEFTIADLPKQIVIYPRSRGGVVRLIDKNDQDFNIILTVGINNNEVSAGLTVYDSKGVRDESKPAHRKNLQTKRQITKNKSVNIVLELDGTHLENSKIALTSEIQSLLDITLDSLARDIKMDKIKLEDAKKKIPADLHQKLEDRIKQ